MFKEQFIQAIHEKKKVELHFFSEEDNRIVVRICAPMDFGPSKKFKDGIDLYHVWDYFPDGGKKPHPIPLKSNQIKKLITIDEVFTPAEFIKWKFIPYSWHVPRDWGLFS